MLTIKELQVQYITDDKGKKTAVVLPIKEFRELLEDLEDLMIVTERRDEPVIPHEEVLAELKKHGKL